MGLRLYFSPIVGDGLAPATAFRPRLSGLAPFACISPTNPDGTPTFTFAMCVVRATDWTALDADAANVVLFDTVDLPDGTFQTFADLKAFLQSKTVADIPSVRRTALNTRLTNHGFDTSQVTLATTWWQVLRGIYRQMGAPQGNDGPQI